VDLDGLAVGKYQLPVEVRPLPSRGLRIEEVLPPKIDVTLTLLVSKSVPLVVDVEGDPPSGFTMGAAVAEDATVTVAGPRDKVDLVQQVVASLDVTGRTESVDQAVRLEARDDRGNLVQGVALTLTPAITNVSMEIRQVSFTRALAVIPDVVGTPASGYNVAGLSVDPATVTVSGPKSFIEGTEFIRTKPVSVDGKDKDVVKTVSLDLPAGVEVRVIGGSNVTVTVKITPAQSEATFGVPVRATNLGGGLSISGALPTVRVTVAGPLPTLLDLSPDDIVASVDLKDKKEGSHRLKVMVTVPSGLEMRAVSPQEIEVSLEKG
jgi:YbbR domain-containing protein